MFFFLLFFFYFFFFFLEKKVDNAHKFGIFGYHGYFLKKKIYNFPTARIKLIHKFHLPASQVFLFGPYIKLPENPMFASLLEMMTNSVVPESTIEGSLLWDWGLNQDMLAWKSTSLSLSVALEMPMCCVRNWLVDMFGCRRCNCMNLDLATLFLKRMSYSKINKVLYNASYDSHRCAEIVEPQRVCTTRYAPIHAWFCPAP